MRGQGKDGCVTFVPDDCDFNLRHSACFLHLQTFSRQFCSDNRTEMWSKVTGTNDGKRNFQVVRLLV